MGSTLKKLVLEISRRENGDTIKMAELLPVKVYPFTIHDSVDFIVCFISFDVLCRLHKAKLRLCRDSGTQWVKRWPVKLAVQVQFRLQANMLSTVNGVLSNAVFYHPDMTEILLKLHYITSQLSFHNQFFHCLYG